MNKNETNKIFDYLNDEFARIHATLEEVADKDSIAAMNSKLKTYIKRAHLRLQKIKNLN